MNDRFQELKLFVRAAETGSFSATARDTGLSQPSVSRIISELEERLGVRLLLRTTRKIVPTDAGAAFLQKAKQILYELDEADEVARGVDSVKGLLRVAASPTMCIRTILPRLSGFLKDHPELRVEFLAADIMHDLVAESVDVAIRFGQLQDSGFGARHLATLERVLMASPAYIAQHGAPQTPDDLQQHDCIFGPTGLSTTPWTLHRDGKKIQVKVEPRFMLTSAEAIIASAREGLGLARAASVLCKNELDSGQLVRLLPGYTLDPVDIHAVYPAGRARSQKVRLFTAFLAEILADHLPARQN